MQRKTEIQIHLIVLFVLVIVSCTTITANPEPTAVLLIDTPAPTATKFTIPTVEPTMDVFEGVDYEEIITLGGEFNDWRVAVNENGQAVRIVDENNEEVELNGEGLLINDNGWLWWYDRDRHVLVDMHFGVDDRGLILTDFGYVGWNDEYGEVAVFDQETGDEIGRFSEGLYAHEGVLYKWDGGSWVEQDVEQVKVGDTWMEWVSEEGELVEIEMPRGVEAGEVTGFENRGKDGEKLVGVDGNGKGLIQRFEGKEWEKFEPQVILVCPEFMCEQMRAVDITPLAEEAQPFTRDNGSKLPWGYLEELDHPYPNSDGKDIRIHGYVAGIYTIEGDTFAGRPMSVATIHVPLESGDVLALSVKVIDQDDISLHLWQLNGGNLDDAEISLKSASLIYDIIVDNGGDAMRGKPVIVTLQFADVPVVEEYADTYTRWKEDILPWLQGGGIDPTTFSWSDEQKLADIDNIDDTMWTDTLNLIVAGWMVASEDISN